MTHVLHHPAVGRGPLHVDGPEGRHAADVRRLRVGEAVDVVDGHGLRGAAVVTAVAKGSLTVDVTDVTVEPVPEPRVVVVQGLPKGERAELAVELCSEVGVDEVVPWQAARCVARWTDRSAQRWSSVARESGKQARRSRFAVVADAVDRAGLLERVAAADLAVVLEATAVTPLGSLPLPDAGTVLLVVGPEGGLDPAELEALRAAGAVPARLGPSVLRTSGAGAVAAAVVLSRLRRWAGPLT